jgi:hypothetical protein
MIPIYLGFDEREAGAIHTCANSIITRASEPVSITYLSGNQLDGIYPRPLHLEGYPPSNNFVFSRFLVPYLQDFKGWAIFADGDMIFREDIAKLWRMRDEFMAAMVVKHDYRTKHPTKYLGSVNKDYPRKNWSSLILWNCGNYSNRILMPETIGRATGEFLHRFQWLQDERIGEIPQEWNWLVSEYERNDAAKMLHYSIGGPYFVEYANCDHAEEWRNENDAAFHVEQRG